MYLTELEEALDELLPSGYQIELDRNGQIIIITNLTENDDGELEAFSAEEMVEFDPDLRPLIGLDD